MMMHVETENHAPLPLPGPDTSGDELFRMGLLYSTGQGGAPLDYVSAHMLFNLAAMRGSLEAKVYRKEIADEMPPMDANGRTDSGWVQWQRNRIDTRKWIAAKLKPKKYGDKVDVNHGGGISLTVSTGIPDEQPNN